MTTPKRWRPKKVRHYDKLSAAEKEEIYFQYENGWREKSLAEFARDCSVAPIDMAKLLKLYQVSTGEDLENELKSILGQDSAIIKKGQSFINEYLDELMKSRKKIGMKEIETIIKSMDSTLKRSTVITKMMEEKKEGNKGAPLEIKLTL